MVAQAKPPSNALTASRTRRREEQPLETASCPPFPEHLLDGTETSQEVMDKVFSPQVVARHYWRLLHATVPFKRKDGTGGETADPATQLRTLIAIDERKNGKPAASIPPAAKPADQADDTAALLERAKDHPAYRTQLMDQFRKLLVELEAIDQAAGGK